MAEKETVVIDNRDRDVEPRRAGMGPGAIVGIIVLVLIILFLLFGGIGWFNRSGSSGTNTTTTPTTTAPVPSTNKAY